MVGGCQCKREEREAEGGKERAKRESPAHSGKTIQLVNEGTHSTNRERGKEVKREKERNSLGLG